MGAPQISGDLTGSVEVGQGLVSGQVQDIGNGFADTWSISSAPGFGTATINASGVWTYDVNPGHPAVAALTFGDTLTDIFTIRLDSLGTDFADVAITITVPCFLRGTLIETPEGARPVEELRPGDLVITLDAGPQPIIWAGRRIAEGTGMDAPVLFEPASIGNRRALRVSPRHRMLLAGGLCEFYTGHPEALAQALHLVNGAGIRREPCAEAEYHHFMLPRHHIVFAEGAACESFFPGGAVAESIPEIRAWTEDARRMAPDAARDLFQLARPQLRASEARLVARHPGALLPVSCRASAEREAFDCSVTAAE